ncbi:MAG: hypothetical protein AB7O62_24650 [Pirellulales bacterium]
MPCISLVQAQDDLEPAKHVMSGFDETVDQIVQDVSHAMQVLNRVNLQVGPIAGPPNASTSSGFVLAIQRHLPEWMESLPGEDSVYLTASYAANVDPTSGRACLAIDAALKDAGGQELHKLPRYLLVDEPSLLILLAGNGSLPLKGLGEFPLSDVRNDALVELLARPKFALQPRGNNWKVSTVARPSAGSPYGIEFLDRIRTDRNGNEYFWPVAVGQQNGQPLVEIDEGHVFAVRLINDTPQPVAVTLTMNGRNILARDPRPGQKPATGLAGQNWIVAGKHSTAMVWGQLADGKKWLADGNKWTEFKSADGGADGSVLTAVFSAAFTDKPPADEPPPAFTVNGEQFLQEGRKVEDRDRPLLMNFGVSRGAVSVRYREEREGGKP